MLFAVLINEKYNNFQCVIKIQAGRYPKDELVLSLSNRMFYQRLSA